MRCPYCDAELPEGTGKCPYCDSEITAEPAPAEPVVTAEPAPVEPAFDAEPALEGEPAFGDVAPEEPVKKSKKGLWIGVGVGMVALAVAAVVLVVTLLGNPASTLMKAYQKTQDALTQPLIQVFGEELVNAKAEDLDASCFTYTMKVAFSESDLNVNADLVFAEDAAAGKASAELSVGIQDIGSIRGSAFVTSDQISLAAPQFWKDRVFTVTRQDLAEATGMDSYPEFFPQQDITAQAKAIQEAAAAYLSSCKVQKGQKLNMAGRNWTSYAIEDDPAQREAFVDTIYNTFFEQAEQSYSNMLEQLPPELLEELPENPYAEAREMLHNFSAPTFFVNESGYLSGIQFTDVEDQVYRFLLTGQENPWSEIRFQDGSTEFATILCKVTGSDLEVTMNIPSSTTMTFTYGSEAYTLNLNIPDESLTLNGALKLQPGRFYMDMDLGSLINSTTGLEDEEDVDFDLTYSMDVVYGTAEPKALTGTETSLMNMNDSEYEAVMEELNQALNTDQELASIFMLLLMLTGGGF